VPYRIADFDSLLRDSKSTVSFDHDEAARIAARCARMGQDGKLVLDAGDEVHLVGLAEKLLVPLLAKLGNLVPGGGIWMNAQRPEWNDANNALVGSGLSMVTLYYMRRYVAFLQALLRGGDAHFVVTAQVAAWLQQTSRALIDAQQAIQADPLDTGCGHGALPGAGAWQQRVSADDICRPRPCRAARCCL
jgi:hypothetical protein